MRPGNQCGRHRTGSPSRASYSIAASKRAIPSGPTNFEAADEAQDGNLCKLVQVGGSIDAALVLLVAIAAARGCRAATSAAVPRSQKRPSTTGQPNSAAKMAGSLSPAAARGEGS